VITKKRGPTLRCLARRKAREGNRGVFRSGKGKQGTFSKKKEPCLGRPRAVEQGRGHLNGEGTKKTHSNPLVGKIVGFHNHRQEHEKKSSGEKTNSMRRIGGCLFYE